MDPNYNQQGYPNYQQQAYPNPQYPNYPPQQGYAPPQVQISPEQLRLQTEAWDSARRLHAGGTHPATIYDILVQKGVDPVAAQRIVQSATLVPAANYKSEAGRDMLIGGLWIIGGVVITVGTYMAVSESGGHYLITYGPIVYGLIRFFKGVAKL